MRSGKCRLTSVGISTLAMAPPASASNDSSANSQHLADHRPQRQPDRGHGQGHASPAGARRTGGPSRGPRNPMPAKAITGSVVMMPATPLEACRPSSRSSSTDADAGDGHPHGQAGQHDGSDHQQPMARLRQSLGHVSGRPQLVAASRHRSMPPSTACWSISASSLVGEGVVVDHGDVLFQLADRGCPDQHGGNPLVAGHPGQRQLGQALAAALRDVVAGPGCGSGSAR